MAECNTLGKVLCAQHNSLVALRCVQATQRHLQVPMLWAVTIWWRQ